MHRMFRARIQQSLALAGILRLMVVASVVALLGIGMCGFLGYFKFQSAVEAATRSRMTVPATSVRAGVEAALSIGIPLARETRELLLRERAADPEIVEIAVVDRAGHPLLSTGAQTTARLDELRMSMRNAFDLPLGDVVVRYAAASSRAALARMRERLVLIVAAGWAATTLLAAAGIVLVARREPPQR